MAITTSLFGKITGKVGAVVYSTSGGFTVVREYNPSVANPSTPAQVDQRAKMKLMSQLSASLSPVLAYTKDGLVSKRNKFVKNNFAAVYALNGSAQVTYENLQITEGNTSLPALYAEGSVAQGNLQISVCFATEPSTTINRVVYSVFKKTAEGKLEFIRSTIIETRKSGDVFFVAEFNDLPVAEYVIFAYGMSDTSERASAVYGNLNVTTASDLARLVATRTISFSDYQFTQTRAITIASDGSAVQPETPGNLRVYVTALGNGGTVSGGGSYAPGASVTVVATPASGFAFLRWIKNGTNETVSTSASYTFTVNEQTDLVAVFGDDSL